ncbi:hypothetical protein BKA65DRAFT_496644 [Rhexocercosporidium sp. MPI-PUGE-AT-0058]|nr:hypothetical protein BKA65DRAFT_496644 [Rhexocercosporidium sp. MPI-PUGE-AT-0058]
MSATPDQWPEANQRPAAVAIEEEPEENPFIVLERKALIETCHTWRKPLRALNTIPHLPQSDLPVLDVFVERFIDAFAPDDRIDCGSSDAIRSAGSVRMFSPLLSDAFHAVSIAYFGQFSGNWRVGFAGYNIYTRVLRRLQSALFHPEQSRSEGVFATVILLMAYESLQHTTERALINHCIHALKLIEFRGPYSHMFGMEHQCFTELLPYWVSTALVLRAPTFLARPEWKTIPWSAETSSKDIMASLLEQVVDLPAILYQFDQLLAAKKSHLMPQIELASREAILWNSITNLKSRLIRWKIEWVDDYPSGQPYESHMLESEPFPVFEYNNFNTGEMVTPMYLVYPDPQLARTMGMYYAARILLASADTRPPHDGQCREQIEFARLICRSMRYYIQTVPGNMINRMAFPLRVAFDTFSEGDLERRYIGAVFQLVQRKNMLKSWGKFMPDISAKIIQ